MTWPRQSYVVCLCLLLWLTACQPVSLPGAMSPATNGLQGQKFVSPDGQWVAVRDGGSLALITQDGRTIQIFPPGASAWSVAWSPDSKLFLVVLSRWEPPQAGTVDTLVNEPPEIWAVPLVDGINGEPQQLVQLDDDIVARSGGGRAEIVFGDWSPDGKAVVFWAGGGAAMRADGNAPFVLDVTTGQVIRVGDWALVNPAYHSWSPDGTKLAMTVGGWRSAQANKWLTLVDVESGMVSTVISKSVLIPGIVAWSPQGDRIAYAAVEALPPSTYVNDDHCCPVTFANPAIDGRRIYLLEPATGKSWRLNSTDAFQDAPVWSEDGSILYYVERHDDTLVLMQSDPATGMAEVVAGSAHPLPDDGIGYYGQSDWHEILAHRPDIAMPQDTPKDTPQEAELSLLPIPTPTPSVARAQPTTLLEAWTIAHTSAQAWSSDATLIFLNSADVDDPDQTPREDGRRRVWQAFYNSPSKNKELHLQIVDGEVTSASEDGIYDPGVPSITAKPQIDSPAALQAVQTAIPGFSFSVGRGKGFHFGLHVDTNGDVVFLVVGASPASAGNQVPTAVTLDPATGQILEKRLLPQ